MLASVLAAGLTGAACTDKPQTIGARVVDSMPHAGNTGTHTAPGWQSGDATSWEAHLKARSQGQNEYSRTSVR